MLVNSVAVRLLRVLSNIHIMNTKYIDLTLAYSQAGVKVPIYLHISQGKDFGKDDLKIVLKLNKNLYRQKSR